MGGLELLAQLLDADDFAEAHGGRAVDQGESCVRLRKMLPDELEHQEFVEISVEQRARDGIHLPVVIVRAPGEIDNHDSLTLLELDAAGKHFDSSKRMKAKGYGS